MRQRPSGRRETALAVRGVGRPGNRRPCSGGDRFEIREREARGRRNRERVEGERERDIRSIYIYI